MIDPYQLLGVDIHSSEKKVRQTYYGLALLCHPDRGGNSEEMKVLHQAYRFILNEIKNTTENPTESYLASEKEFEEFCQKQTLDTPPFEQIYQENNVFIQEFNKQWDRNHASMETTDNSNNTYDNILSHGYGDVMEASEYSAFNSSLSPPSSSTPPSSTPGYQPTISTNDQTSSSASATSSTSNYKPFSRQVIEYKEPQSLPDQYGSNVRLDTREISDYSHQTSNLALNDYRNAFSEPEKIEETPLTDLSESLEEIQKRRDNQLYKVHDQNDLFWKERESFEHLSEDRGQTDKKNLSI